jgi:hypothetical protein
MILTSGVSTSRQHGHRLGTGSHWNREGATDSEVSGEDGTGEPRLVPDIPCCKRLA